MIMRKAISVTLAEDNLLWLRGQAARAGKGSVIELLDRIVTDARARGLAAPGSVRSVAGTIDLPEDDPDLAGADAYLRALFEASARRPTLVRERPPQRAAPGRGRRG
jgi:hypothetical protein